MNKKLSDYIVRHGSERLSNSHLIFINSLIDNRQIGEFGYLYKLSNIIYRKIKGKEVETLKEVIDNYERKY